MFSTPVGNPAIFVGYVVIFSKLLPNLSHLLACAHLYVQVSISLVIN